MEDRLGEMEDRLGETEIVCILAVVTKGQSEDISITF
jgi:hypothetical protein